MSEKLSGPPFEGLRVVFVSPMTPAFTGNGLAMRAASLIEALAKCCVIDLLILPVLEPAGTAPDPAVQARCSSYHIVPPLKQKPSWADRGAIFLASIFSLSRNVAGAAEAAWKRKIGRTLALLQPDLLFVYRLTALAQITPNRLRSVSVWLDLDELDSAALRREAAVAKTDRNEARCKALQSQAAALESLENRLLPLAHWLSVSSSVERDFLSNEQRLKAVVLPNVVRSRAPLREREESANPFRLLFVGSFGHAPNVDAVEYFHGKIFHRIQQLSLRTVEFVVVGPDPRQQLLRFHGEKNVKILGRLDDLAPAYQEADLVVVPLRMGAGTRIKILEAFSYGRCVVSTPRGAEGLDVSSGRELIIAECDEAFAAACAELLVDRERRQALAGRAADWLASRHLPVHLQEALTAAWSKHPPKPS